MPQLLKSPADQFIKSSPDYSELKKLAQTRLDSETAPPVPLKALGQVSEQRRAMLEGEVEGGLFRDKGIEALKKIKGQSTPLGNVIGFSKKADVAYSSNSSGGSGYNYRGSGGTVRQGPNIYSPLWLMSNINLPRDRATINSWCRAFYALNAFVQNAISLHCTYPISKLNIKCKDKKIQNFFETLNEEINLTDVCTQVALDYWVLGEAFPYAELNEATGKWSRISLQNPDYIMVQQSPVAGESLISLRPDDGLKRLVMSNKPADLQQRQKIDKRIVELVRQGKNIPLDNSYVSHLARKITPQETRGTGLLVSCFKALMIFDSIRECFDSETEILTNKGFKKIEEITKLSNNNNAIGVLRNKDNESIAKMELIDESIQIACFNSTNEKMEFHSPPSFLVKEYEGEMIHFKNHKIDLKVTPNHDLWVSKQGLRKVENVKKREIVWKNFKKVPAKNLDVKKVHRFRSIINWDGKEIEFVDVCGKQVPIELYLQFLGYLTSEGWLYKKNHTFGFCQTVVKYYDKMKNCFDEFSKVVEKSYSSRIRKVKKKNHNDAWYGIMAGKDLFNHFLNEIGDSEKRTKSKYKKLPRWIFELSPRLLKILLEALVEGDGSHSITGKDLIDEFGYFTTSKQLADDVYEIVYKCGFVPILSTEEGDCRKSKLYRVKWSSSEKGNYPQPALFSKNSATHEKKKTYFNEFYKGIVWCFESPTGLLITRRNGKITIQGNCKVVQSNSMINPQTIVKLGGGTGEYKPLSEDLEKWREIIESAFADPDFKIITHDSVNIERIGWNGGILDTTNDVAALIKEIHIGLLVPSVLMDGGSDTTYSNGGVALDVLKARYYSFRNMMTRWLRRKIFAPMSKMNDFYEYVDGKKTLVVPDIDWNHMSLFDAGDYIQVVKELSVGENPTVSLQTLYRSLGLDYEEEKRKRRREMIDRVILKKEEENLMNLGLPELRALSDDDVIQETKDSPLPGEEQLPGQEGDTGGLDSMPGLSDSGSNAPVPPGPPPSAPT